MNRIAHATLAAVLGNASPHSDSSKHGIVGISYLRFGTSGSPKSLLAAIKAGTKQDLIISFHAYVGPMHPHNIAWINQLCRTAHRADIPWSMELREATGAHEAIERLRSLQYVSVSPPACQV